MASSALHTSSSRERERVSERASEREGSEDAGVASTTIAGLWGWLILILTYFLFVVRSFPTLVSFNRCDVCAAAQHVRAGSLEAYARNGCPAARRDQGGHALQ